MTNIVIRIKDGAALQSIPALTATDGKIDNDNYTEITLEHIPRIGETVSLQGIGMKNPIRFKVIDIIYVLKPTSTSNDTKVEVYLENFDQ